jgi:porin
MFGWPALPSYDLPGGGPAYPLSALGMRLRWRPVNPINILAGIFSGSPAPSADGDPQRLNGAGLSFPVSGALAFLEMQYAYPALGAMAYPGAGAPLGHTYKIGAWYDSQAFDDQRLDAAGLPLASPASTGVPRRHRGDYSIYAVADQMIWRQGNDPNRSLSVFARVMGAPQADRNLIAFSVNAGLTYHDPVANRPDDTFAVGMGYAQVSGAAIAADQDAAAVAGGAFSPVRGGETYIEAVYQYQMRPWWQIQPDLQYVFRPGAGIADPAQPSQLLKDELVLGVRTNVLF